MPSGLCYASTTMSLLSKTHYQRCSLCALLDRLRDGQGGQARDQGAAWLRAGLDQGQQGSDSSAALLLGRGLHQHRPDW